MKKTLVCKKYIKKAIFLQKEKKSLIINIESIFLHFLIVKKGETHFFLYLTLLVFEIGVFCVNKVINEIRRNRCYLSNARP